MFCSQFSNVRTETQQRNISFQKGTPLSERQIPNPFKFVCIHTYVRLHFAKSEPIFSFHSNRTLIACEEVFVPKQVISFSDSLSLPATGFLPSQVISFNSPLISCEEVFVPKQLISLISSFFAIHWSISYLALTKPSVSTRFATLVAISHTYARATLRRRACAVASQIRRFPLFTFSY